MTSSADKARQQKARTEAFRALHVSGCFIVPNPWDVASARMLARAGFKALATTSSGYAFSQGRKDGAGDISLLESLAYGARIVAATGLPVTADLEDGYADNPEGVAETVRLAAEAGLSGVSIEDSDPGDNATSRPFDQAVKRAAAAAEAARHHNVVFTARADGLLSGAYNVDEAVKRLVAFASCGADVVYAPGVPNLAALSRICRTIPVPVNYVAGLGGEHLSFAAVKDAGVRRISLGGSLTRAVYGKADELFRGIAGGDLSPLFDAPRFSEL